jgi:hypothetical protein
LINRRHSRIKRCRTHCSYTLACQLKNEGRRKKSSTVACKATRKESACTQNTSIVLGCVPARSVLDRLHTDQG